MVTCVYVCIYIYVHIYIFICVCVYMHTCMLSCSLWTLILYIALQAPLFMRFSREEYWGGLPCPPPGDLPDPGIKPGLLHCKHIFYIWAIRGSFYIYTYIHTYMYSKCIYKYIYLYMISVYIYVVNIKIYVLEFSHICLFATPWPSQLKDGTQVSCVTGRFFTIWANREAPPPQHTHTYTFI